MPQAFDQNGYVVPCSFRAQSGFGQSVAYTGTAGTIVTEISTVKATSVLTSTGVIPADGDTVTIGANTYTFKAALTPTAGEVLRGANADAALLNLIRAINHSGTPGTDYANAGIGAVVHPTVSAATAVTAHAFLITALVAGSAGNAIQLNDTADVRITWSGESLSGGVDNARNTSFIAVVCTSAAYVRVGVDPTAVTTDRYVPAGVEVIFPCTWGDKVSAVQVAAGGNLHVTELD